MPVSPQPKQVFAETLLRVTLDEHHADRMWSGASVISSRHGCHATKHEGSGVDGGANVDIPKRDSPALSIPTTLPPFETPTNSHTIRRHQAPGPQVYPITPTYPSPNPKRNPPKMCKKELVKYQCSHQRVRIASQCEVTDGTCIEELREVQAGKPCRVCRKAERERKREEERKKEEKREQERQRAILAERNMQQIREARRIGDERRIHGPVELAADLCWKFLFKG